MAIVLSWNVAGRVALQEMQIKALAKRTFDLLCLQEVTPSTRARWEQALADQGMNVAVSEWPEPPRGSRRLAVLIASVAPVRPQPQLELPWPERHLAVRTSVDGVDVEVHTLHAPLSQKLELVKVRTLERVYEAVTIGNGDLPRRGWSDAFRALHGYERRDRSWCWRTGFRYRLDHILLSPPLAAKDCDYLHDWREQGLSDHSPIWAEVAWSGGG